MTDASTAWTLESSVTEVPMCALLTFSHALRKQGAPADQLTRGEMGESALSWEKIPALQQPLLSHSRPRYDRTREDCIRSGFSFLHLRGRRSELWEELLYHSIFRSAPLWSWRRRDGERACSSCHQQSGVNRSTVSSSLKDCLQLMSKNVKRAFISPLCYLAGGLCLHS